ncbi:CHAT domain-containing protein [Rhodofomes roseus]|uniref:CHAT domain-containing protein n=1 Tax=Rhodofomes roseus TaxID=34475 RepID=A0ABQ8KAY7_9APHY|nr:CHAT domain-containing protein [Rhodofomes roseus]KAH9834618.1 CHAT domain-containing protein [Rhodofomes roseus]
MVARMPVSLEMGGPAVPIVKLAKRDPYPELDSQIDELKDVLLRNPEGSDPFLDAMESMAHLYDTRFALAPHQPIDRDEAIDLRRELARVCPKGSPKQLEAMHRLAVALQRRSFPERLLHDHIIQEPPSNRQSYTVDDLDEIIATQNAALSICDPDHDLYAPLTGQLGSSMLHRIKSVSELQQSLLLLRSACVLWPANDPHRLPVLQNLANALSSLIGASEKTGAIAEMLEAVDVHRQLAAQHPHTSAQRIQSLSEMARFLSRLCSPPVDRLDLVPLLRNTADDISQITRGDGTLYRALADALESSTESLFPEREINPLDQHPQLVRVHYVDLPVDVTQPSPSKFLLRPLYFADPSLLLDDIDGEIHAYLYYLLQRGPLLDTAARGLAYSTIGALFRHRYVNSKESRDLNAAIEYQQAAWHMTDVQDDDFYVLTRNLEDAFQERYFACHDIEDYKRSIKLSVWPMENRPVAMGPQLLPTPMGSLPPLAPRQLESRAQQRDWMIQWYREQITDSESPSAAVCGDLAANLFERFTTTWPFDFADLTEVLRFLDKMDAAGSRSSSGIRSLPTRTMVYSSWYRRTGDPQHLTSAIAHLSTGTIADRMQVLWERYVQNGTLADLDKAIVMGRRVSSSFSLGENDMGFYRTPLALCLLARYDREGDPADIEEAVALPHAPSTDLAEAYLLRYERYGRIEDLDYAFRTGAFDVDPDPNDLGLDADELEDVSGDLTSAFVRRALIHCRVLLARHALNGSTNLLRVAETVLTPAEQRCPLTLQASVLKCKATLLMSRASVLNVHEVDEAIAAATTALQYTAESDVRRPGLNALLGDAYRSRYVLSKTPDDLESSIKTLRICLAGISPSNPHYADYQISLGKSLEILSGITFDKSLSAQAITALRDTAQTPAASLHARYSSALSWARIADANHDADALLAYDVVMELLPQFASLGLDIRDRHQSLTRSASGVASDAAACAIRHNDLPKAVEFLEYGRSVFWRQALRLKTPMTELMEHEPELAHRLAELARDLNISSFRTRTEGDSEAQDAFIIREGPKRRALAEEWERLLTEARNVEGCEDLLRLPPYQRLRQAASSSTVVLLACTEQSGYALIVEEREPSPRYLPLPSISRSRVSDWVDRLRGTLKQANRGARQAMDLTHLIEPYRYSGQPRQKTQKTQREEVILVRLLGAIWRDIVKPVLDFIGVSGEMRDDPPRITWCPVGALALLPVHAAGIYDKTSGPCASDYIVSSYTPTLSNILPTSTPSAAHSPINVLLVGQADSPGHPPIPNVGVELKMIEDVLCSISHTRRVQGPDATQPTVLTEMAKSHITHLACHGIARPNPLDSAIVLRDGSLPVSRLMRTPFSDAKLVFLSACQTARLSPSEPDESINIASAMLSAGFQTAVATMWSISDDDAPRIAESFYRHLLQGEKIDLGGAARALHAAIRACQKSDMSPLQWAAFIHVGL